MLAGLSCGVGGLTLARLFVCFLLWIIGVVGVASGNSTRYYVDGGMVRSGGCGVGRPFTSVLYHARTRVGEWILENMWKEKSRFSVGDGWEVVILFFKRRMIGYTIVESGWIDLVFRCRVIRAFIWCRRLDSTSVF